MKLKRLSRKKYLFHFIYTISGIKAYNSDKELYKNTIDTITAVHLASAITAYSRIFMYDFKNIKNNECYYTDTDSIFVPKELDPKYINSELGGFKEVYKVRKGYFIAPKAYLIQKQNYVLITLFFFINL